MFRPSGMKIYFVGGYHLTVYPEAALALAKEAAAKNKSEDIPTIAGHLANLPKANENRSRVVLVTQGSSPTVIAVSGTPGHKDIPVRKISAAEIIGTTGTGDAFAGGLLAGIVQQKSLETSVDMGNWLAHLGIQQVGPNYPLPRQSFTPV
ncbi:Adenosine kinase [Penicillium canariense]|uniref:Adenosine kinase n=1 Tax=Penicillium canariense TaxID=189055 RepID=A0A9W9IJV6_9EURO|nr:Adenosine kinase [Penicillium canariense]KAJ5177010.1 Adenosine kinase [Penicillium canariense]